MKKTIFLIVLMVISNSLFGQTTYELNYKTDVYTFLERLSSKNKIVFFSDIRPLTRLNLASTFQHLERSDNLSSIERERIDFYKRDYAFEIKYMQEDTSTVSNFFGSAPIDKFNFYKYYSKDFDFTFDPIVGIGYNFSENIYHQFVGFELYGRIGDNWGYYLNWRDNIEKGDSIDRGKRFSPKTGINVLRSKENLIGYSETRGA